MFFYVRSALEATDLREGLAFWSEPPNPVLVVVRSRLRAVRIFSDHGSNLREGLAFWRLSCLWLGFMRKMVFETVFAGIWPKKCSNGRFWNTKP